jgi:alkylhydroperoxidase family enzyme
VTAGAGDSGIPNATLLIEFAEAVLGTDAARLAAARSKVLEVLGAEALVDAAAVAGFFNAIDRVADATGTPLDEKTLADTAELREELGIDEFQHNSRHG